jgi:uncharacterized membrane protein YfcA
MEKLLVLSAVFFVVSAVFSMIGMGGGTLYVPILLFAGYTIKQAPAISLVLIIATSATAMTAYWRGGRVDWKLTAVIGSTMLVAAFAGGYFSGFASKDLLLSLLAGVLVVAGVLMLKNPAKDAAPVVRGGARWLWHRHFGGHDYRINLPLTLGAAALVSMVSGMLGITGGIIILPVMVLLCGVPMDVAIASTMAIVGLTALSGLAGHAIHGHIEWTTAAALAVSAALGGFAGGKISLSMNKDTLKKSFGVLVLLIAARMIFRLVAG